MTNNEEEFHNFYYEYHFLTGSYHNIEIFIEIQGAIFASVYIVCG